MAEPHVFASSLNYIDFIVLAVMGLSIFIGLVRGFTREFFGALGWTGATMITFWGNHYLQVPVRHWVGNPFFADLITLIILFITSLFILLSLSRSLSFRVKASVLGGLDRSLGVVFGIVRGAVICVSAFLIVNTLWKAYQRPQELQTARSYPFLLKATEIFARLLPKGTIPASFYHPYPIANWEGEISLPALEKRSPEDLMKSLAKPKTASLEETKVLGYPDNRRRDMDRLFKNYGGQEEDK